MKNIKKIVSYALLGLLFSAFIIGARARLSVTCFDTVFSYLAYPILQMQHVLVDPIKKIIADRHRTVTLEQELQQLRAAYDSLQAENILLKATDIYHKEIEELAAYKVRYEDKNAVVASVLTRIITDTEHYFLVDVGAKHGIRQDMVAVYQNCLVGRVEVVYPWYAKIRLISDTACKVAAFCAQTKARGIHEGCNNDARTLLQYVSHLAELNDGDTVLSSGDGLIFPQGFGLGRIKKYQKNGLYQNVELEPLIDVRNLGYCVLMAKGGSHGVA